MAIKRKVVTTFQVVNRGNPNTLDGWTDGRMIYVHICTGEDNDGKDNENIDEKITNEDLEMSVTELFPNEDCPRPGTDPGECSSDDLLTRSCTSGG